MRRQVEERVRPWISHPESENGLVKHWIDTIQNNKGAQHDQADGREKRIEIPRLARALERLGKTMTSVGRDHALSPLSVLRPNCRENV